MLRTIAFAKSPIVIDRQTEPNTVPYGARFVAWIFCALWFIIIAYLLITPNAHILKEHFDYMSVPFVFGRS